MEETGLVPLFYNEDISVCKALVKACYDGGARLMEFTSRGDFAINIFSELSQFVKSEMPKMALGVGSITDAAAASAYMLQGADFIVTPVFREDIARVCNRRKVLWSPGCASPTEVATAEELGCEVVKLFPGGVYGPGLVKAIKAPAPWTKIMPTGGVSPDKDNLLGWFNAGVTCVGMGSKLISKQIIADKDYDGLQAKVASTIELIKEVRKG